MGYNFDDNGKYIKWSDLFDYSSIKTLQASEYLPYPDNVEYKKNDSGIDISEDIKSIAAKTDKAEKIMEYASLLSRLQEIRPVYERQQTAENKENKGRVLGKFRYITWDNTIDDSIANEVLNNLNIHARTYISPYNEQKGLKNFISSRISNIVQNIRNMDLAYSPVKMDDVKKGSELSPKGQRSKRMTLMNPLTKFIMQDQNLTGKATVGVYANGEKLFYNLTYYWNEGIRSRDPEWIRNLNFRHIYTRLKGRATNNLQPKEVTELVDINVEGYEDILLYIKDIANLDTNLRKKYNITNSDIEEKTDKWKQYRDELVSTVKQSHTYTYADDLISQLLSAATDFRRLKIYVNK